MAVITLVLVELSKAGWRLGWFQLGAGRDGGVRSKIPPRTAKKSRKLRSALISLFRSIFWSLKFSVFIFFELGGGGGEE